MSSEQIIKVGDGATYHLGSDRYPYTVVEVLGPKKLVVQRDHAQPAEGHSYYGTQKWDIGPDLTAEREVITLRKNGRWVYEGGSAKDSGFTIGSRERYDDPSF